MRLRQIGNDIAAALVGDRHLGKAGAELAGLGNDPDAGLRSEPAGDDPADVVIVDLDLRRLRLSRGLLRARPEGHAERDKGDSQYRQNTGKPWRSHNPS